MGLFDLLGYSLSPREARAEVQGRSREAEAETMLLTIFSSMACLISLLSYATQSHPPGGDTSHSGLSLLHQSNQDSAHRLALT